MKVAQIAKALGISPDTVRFYTRIGYLKPSVNSDNGYKSYPKSQLARLNFILAARNLGFSVKDIGAILAETDQGHAACSLTRELIEQRLQESEQQFLAMVALRERMLKATEQWRNMPNKEPTGDSICHLIEDFCSEYAGENLHENT